MPVPTVHDIRDLQPVQKVDQPSAVLYIPTSAEMYAEKQSMAPTSATMPYEPPLPPLPPVDYKKAYMRNCYGRFSQLEEFQSIT